MKHIFPLSVLLVALLWVGCTTGTNPSGGGGNGDKVSLEMKMEPGMVYKLVTKTEQKIEQTMMGMKTKMATSTEVFLKNEVLSVGADGVAEVKCTYERVRMETDNAMIGKRTYDSNDAASEAPMEAAGYQGLIGKNISFKIDKHGTVVSVMGVDSLLESIMATMGGDAGAADMGKMKEALKMTFGDEGMKSMMQAASIQYPDVLVAEGDTWGKQTGQMGMMPMKMDVTYKVDHIDADKVILSFEGTVSTDKAKALDLGIASVEMDISGKYTGTSEISRKTGMVLSSTMNQDLTGSVSTMGMKMPMSIDQKVTVNPY